MLGILLNEKEGKELELLIKREIEEMQCNEKGKAHHPIVQKVIEERYKLLLNILLRIAPKSDDISCLNAIKKAENNFNKNC